MKLATLLISFLILAVGPARAADDDLVKKDLAELQGEWSMVSGSADGQAMPDQMRQQMKRVCKDDETTTTMAGQIYLKAKFTIDPSKKPKTIDYEMTDGFAKGKKQLGIYELDGDTFKACFGGPGAQRPTDFSSPPGDRRTLSVWKREKTTPSGSTVRKERVQGAFRFPGEQFLKITGKVKVLDAHTIAFDDGTEVELNGETDAPDLEQKGLLGNAFYPCGREAAEFLRKWIGDHVVTCFVRSDDGDKPRRRGYCFVQEKNLQTEMVRNGWALSHHSATEAWEVIARENRRGIWRGTFVTPERWRKGERLPGE